MISSRKELKFYIKADRIMNGFNENRSFQEVCKNKLLYNSLIIDYLYYMRLCDYYSSMNKRSIFDIIRYKFYQRKFANLGVLLGISIGPSVFGYGLLIPHYGTIVVNSNVRAGNFCVLHTSTCIGGGDKIIGNGLYLASGAMIMGEGKYGNNVSIASNSLANCGAPSNVLLAGSPATIKCSDYAPWYMRDGIDYENRIKKVQQLKIQMNL